MKASPLFIPALWEDDHFKVLDETLLPWKLEYIPVREVSRALQAVKEMKTRAFGQVLTFLYSAALAAESSREKDPLALRERLRQLAEEFSAARPTFDFKGLASFFPKWVDEFPAGEDPRRWVRDKALEMASTIIGARERRARLAAEILPGPCRLLTHCNVSGELVAVASWCEEMGKKLAIVATETRPYLQGSRLTAWEISQAGIEIELVPDCAVAQVMEKGKVDAVLVGTDRCAQNGDIINKVGTYPIALMARAYGIPFYALVQDPGRLESGDDAVIEERPASELFNWEGLSLTLEGLQGIRGRYPAFDVTPARLVSSLIGFDGVWTPEGFRARYQKKAPEPKAGKKEKERYLLLYGIPGRSAYSYLVQALKGEEGAAVLVPEMRPEMWGVHVVGRELLERKIPTTLISDNMMGILFARDQIRRLYLFYTGLSEKGVMGICGSLLAVRLARAHEVPIELLAAEENKEGPLDQDISTFLGRRVSPDGVTIYPVEREFLPWPLFRESSAGIS